MYTHMYRFLQPGNVFRGVIGTSGDKGSSSKCSLRPSFLSFLLGNVRIIRRISIFVPNSRQFYITSRKAIYESIFYAIK